MIGKAAGGWPTAWRGQPTLLGDSQAFDRFEVGSELVRGQAARGAVGLENAVPTAFETVRGQRKVRGQSAGVMIEVGIAAVRRLPGDSELGADEETVILRARSSQ